VTNNVNAIVKRFANVMRFNSNNLYTDLNLNAGALVCVTCRNMGTGTPHWLREFPDASSRRGI